MNIIETERLQLAEFTADDAPFILELLNTPLWLKFIGDRKVTNVDEARNYLLYGPMSSYEKSGFGFYNVKLKEGNVSLGMCGLVKRDALPDVDLGFAFLPQHEKKGYAYEAAGATLMYAQSTLQLKRVLAITLENNESCIRLLKKLGMHFEQKIKITEEELMLYAITLKNN